MNRLCHNTFLARSQLINYCHSLTLLLYNHAFLCSHSFLWSYVAFLSRDESAQFFSYCLFISVLALKIKFPREWGLVPPICRHKPHQIVERAISQELDLHRTISWHVFSLMSSGERCLFVLFLLVKLLTITV